MRCLQPGRWSCPGRCLKLWQRVISSLLPWRYRHILVVMCRCDRVKTMWSLPLSEMVSLPQPGFPAAHAPTVSCRCLDQGRQSPVLQASHHVEGPCVSNMKDAPILRDGNLFFVPRPCLNKASELIIAFQAGSCIAHSGGVAEGKRQFFPFEKLLYVQFHLFRWNGSSFREGCPGSSRSWSCCWCPLCVQRWLCDGNCS